MILCKIGSKMVAYTRDEIISASEMARSFSSVLNELIDHTKDRFAISKNNYNEPLYCMVL